MLKIFAAACAASCVCCAAHAAEPAANQGGGVSPRHSKTIASFSVAGSDLAVTAKGRRAVAGTAERYLAIKKDVALAKSMGSAPPAYLTFDLSLSF